MTKKFYITTAIAYVNAPPHLGFALESVQADIIARYRRQQGDEVFFLTGTDEHGAKIVRAAEAQGITPQELTDTNSDKFKQLKEVYNLSWDDFIRTSDQQRHWPNVVSLWQKLSAAGDIYKKNYRGLYCVGHEAFVTEKDLVDGKCRDHQNEPEVIEEENYFFRLSKYALEIADKIKTGQLKIYPESRANEIISFINEGVNDISFSRPRKDLSWGVPVPDDESQTVYVWCDALANYLHPKDWFPAQLHIIGKDILRFHALFWPGMLLSAGLPLPEAIFVHGHITVNGQKMSKTLGNVIDPVALVEKYGVDPVRYYLTRELPPFEDGDFSYEKFEIRYQADLANGLGNFYSRVLALAKKFHIVTPSRITDQGLANFNDLAERAVIQKMEEYQLNEALEAIWGLIHFSDGYLNQHQPWKTGNPQVIGDCLLVIEKLGELLTPFLPETAEKIKTGETAVLFPRLPE